MPVSARSALLCGIAASVCAGIAQAAVERQIPEQKYIRTLAAPRFMTYTYLPKGVEPRGDPVILYSGDWGWTALLQDTASYMASKGRYVLGIDGSRYFTSVNPTDTLTADLAKLRGVLNERASRPKDAPIILVGFSSGAEIIPYLLNRAGVGGIRGAVLISPDARGKTVFNVSDRLNLEGPPEERFDVTHEMSRLAPIPVALMDGSLDSESAAKELAEKLRGPHKYAPVVGGDKQFHDVRDTYLEVLSQALAWIEDMASRPSPSPAAAEPTPPLQ